MLLNLWRVITFISHQKICALTANRKHACPCTKIKIEGRRTFSISRVQSNLFELARRENVCRRRTFRKPKSIEPYRIAEGGKSARSEIFRPQKSSITSDAYRKRKSASLKFRSIGIYGENKWDCVTQSKKRRKQPRVNRDPRTQANSYSIHRSCTH